jgi:aminoglycoside phosphotransferase (APT) family kinase protein
VSLADCLPPELRAASPTITRIATGLSGAGVHRVESGARTFVLKVSTANEPLDVWRRRLSIQKSAAIAGLAPPVVHVDEERRAIVSDFVVDQSFPAFYGNPRTRHAAIAQLGAMLRRVHELPLPPGGESTDARALLQRIWFRLESAGEPPAFAGDAVRRIMTDAPPDAGRAPVLSHNDVNPTNLVYDGENLLLLDWDTAATNDPFFDLATIALFLRMDDDDARRLLAAHDEAAVTTLPARFCYDRRVAAVLCGTMFLHLARQRGRASQLGGDTLDSALSLGEFYRRMGAGAIDPATGEGQWTFGLALLKESVAL